MADSTIFVYMAASIYSLRFSEVRSTVQPPSGHQSNNHGTDPFKMDCFLIILRGFLYCVFKHSVACVILFFTVHNNRKQ